MMRRILQQFFQKPAWGFGLSALMAVFLTPWLFLPALLLYSLFLLKVFPREHPRKGMLDNFGVMLMMAGLTIYGNYYFLTDGYLLMGNVPKARLAFLCGFQDRVNRTFDRGGTTPLHYAAQQGNEEMVDFLIENGAKIDAQNRTGATPLYVAAYYRQWRCAQKLLEKGANQNLPTIYGVRPDLSGILK